VNKVSSKALDGSFMQKLDSLDVPNYPTIEGYSRRSC